MFNPSRWRNIATARTLFVMLFMAGIGLMISIVSLLYLSQHLISSKTNAIDAHRSALSVDGAIQTSVNRVLSLVVDNAIWDDAVHKVFTRRSWTPAGCTTPGARALKSITFMTAPSCWMSIFASYGDRFTASRSVSRRWTFLVKD